MPHERVEGKRRDRKSPSCLGLSSIANDLLKPVLIRSFIELLKVERGREWKIFAKIILI